MNHRPISRASETRTVAETQPLPSPFRGEISERLQAADLERRKTAFQLPLTPPTILERVVYFLRIIGL